VLVALLAKFAWRPLLQALESRQESIRKSLDDAQQAKQELEAAARRVAEIIRQSRVGGPTRLSRAAAATPSAARRDEAEGPR
jgi:F-type H+-transporting ATPase subunit b